MECPTELDRTMEEKMLELRTVCSISKDQTRVASLQEGVYITRGLKGESCRAYLLFSLPKSLLTFKVSERFLVLRVESCVHGEVHYHRLCPIFLWKLTIIKIHTV